jgi:hypothetical protein
VLLESTHVKAPDGSENEKLIKMDLTRSSFGPFMHDRCAIFIVSDGTEKTISEHERGL